ncbi:hypothetical protein KUV26_21425 [Leisingera daeponensis]|uniref:Uncharacterized protein n=1 Tax=Leisingera daeponensis TaxID=405746 RepID=A0ABS7NLD2_9RHOB|nr:hypothetical protein [Leisingera daeponensis]MBY6142003.1 hypothetical protein [Leisingera daeponensis]
MRENKRSREILRVFAKISGIYGEIGQDVFRLIVEAVGLPVPKELQREALDKRLKRLDDARDALYDTVTAVDELRDEIEEGRQEHQRVMSELSRTLESKESADSKLASLRKLIEADQDTLREVTAPQNVVRQHTIGFILGVTASLVAAGLIYFTPLAIGALSSWKTSEVTKQAIEQDDVRTTVGDSGSNN